MAENPAHPLAVVRSRLTSPHPVAAATQAAALQASPDETRRIDLRRPSSARLTVSRAELPRALRILDALFKAAEGRGWRVGAHERTARVFVRDQAVAVAILEETTKRPHVPTRGQQREIDRGYPHRVPTHDREPTGRLRLKLPDCYEARRTSFGDGVRQRLEHLLDDVLDEVDKAVAARERRAADYKRQAQKRLQTQVRALEVEYQRVTASRQVGAVYQQAEHWQRAVALKQYRDEVQRHCDDAGVTSSHVRQWLTWVDEHLAQALAGAALLPRLPDPPDRGDLSVFGAVQLGGNPAWLEWLEQGEAARPGVD